MVLVIIAATVIIFIALAINEDNYIKKTYDHSLLQVCNFEKKIILLGAFKEVLRTKQVN